MVLAAPARDHVQKKTLIAVERERADVALARWLWHRGQGEIDPARLVFVDETGTATNMAPLYGWGPSCERVVGRAPHGRWTSTTFVAGLTRSGFVAPMVIEGSMNARTFQAWVERVLIPELPDRAIVVMDKVMDNLSSHKGARVRELLEAAGAEALYLPPYSPDLNPIEQAFAKLKHLLRLAQRRTSEALWDRIGELLACFEPTECANYLVNAGYRAS